MILPLAFLFTEKKKNFFNGLILLTCTCIVAPRTPGHFRKPSGVCSEPRRRTAHQCMWPHSGPGAVSVYPQPDRVSSTHSIHIIHIIHISAEHRSITERQWSNQPPCLNLPAPSVNFPSLGQSRVARLLHSDVADSPPVQHDTHAAQYHI